MSGHTTQQVKDKALVMVDTNTVKKLDAYAKANNLSNYGEAVKKLLEEK